MVNLRILPRQPAHTVSKSPGTSFVQRCEHLAIAMREAEKLAQRLRVDVRVYGGERLVKTIKLPA
jgi:hypothetical protein